MLTSHAKRIFSDNVTCFGKNKSCSNRSHLPQCFIKALRFLLAWLLCFYTENPRIFFWKAIFATSPIAPAVTIHTLPWKMRIQNVPCLFSMASSLVLVPSICVLPTAFKTNSVPTSWKFSPEQVRISPTYQVTYLLLGRMKVTHRLSIEKARRWNAG